MLRLLIARVVAAATLMSVAGVGLAQVVGQAMPGGDELLFSSAPGWRAGRWQVNVLDIRRGIIAPLAMSTTSSNPGLPVVWSPDGQRIAYVSGSSAHAETYVVDATGGNRRLLNPASDQDTYGPAWSPDGRFIAFVSGPYVYLADSSGANVRQLTQHTDEYHYLAWSPDSRQLVLQNVDDELFTVDTASGQLRHLTAELANSLLPVWSPDGQQIAFLSKRGKADPSPGSGTYYSDARVTYAFPPLEPGELDVYVVNPDGSDLRRLTHERQANSRWRIRWSPDGRRLLLASWAWTSGSSVYGVDVASGDVRRLTGDEESAGHPAWSPDGSRIAFESRQDGHWQIHVMDGDGGSRQQLTWDAYDHRIPVWSPDGNAIAFLSNSERLWDLCLIELDTGALYRLTSQSGIEFAPAWRPQ